MSWRKFCRRSRSAGRKIISSGGVQLFPSEGFQSRNNAFVSEIELVKYNQVPSLPRERALAAMTQGFVPPGAGVDWRTQPAPPAGQSKAKLLLVSALIERLGMDPFSVSPCSAV